MSLKRTFLYIIGTGVASLLFPVVVGASPINESQIKEYVNQQRQQRNTEEKSALSPELQAILKAKAAEINNEKSSTEQSGISTYSLTGRTSVGYVATDDKTPVIYGSIPSWCSDVAISIFPDTADIKTGSGIYTYFSVGETGFVEDGLDNIWGIDLGDVGLSLQNGKYNIYVSSACGYSYEDPFYSDLYYDKIFIYPNQCNASCTPVHRFYNKRNGAHFYTSSEHEKRKVMEDKGTYNYEGITNFARTSQQSGTVAVHRFYHKQNGTHFYTSSQREATNVNNNLHHTYRYEGVAHYGHTNNATGRTPVHRFYKFKQGVHFYTSNQAEATNVNNTMSNTYRYEGVSYYNIENR